MNQYNDYIITVSKDCLILELRQQARHIMLVALGTDSWTDDKAIQLFLEGIRQHIYSTLDKV